LRKINRIGFTPPTQTKLADGAWPPWRCNRAAGFLCTNYVQPKAQHQGEPRVCAVSPAMIHDEGRFRTRHTNVLWIATDRCI